MSNRNLLALLLAVSSLLSLTACDSVGEALGMSRVTPDEKAVTTNDPLSLPPDFEIKPPRESPKSEEENREGPSDPALTK